MRFDFRRVALWRGGSSGLVASLVRVAWTSKRSPAARFSSTKPRAACRGISRVVPRISGTAVPQNVAVLNRLSGSPKWHQKHNWTASGRLSRWDSILRA